MSGQLGVGGACLIVAAVGTVLLARYWPARTVEESAPRRGRHRAPVPVAAPLVAPEPGPEPVEALVYETAHCPTCHTDTEHVRFAVLNGLMCPSCPPWGQP